METVRAWPIHIPAPLLLAAGFVIIAGAQRDPLPSWNDGPSKHAIVSFVSDTVRSGATTFVAPADRIAVFDNDGTLWAEQPIYVQFQFALDRVKALAPQHPEWKTTPPFSAILAGDVNGMAATGEKGLAEIMTATLAGMTPDEFAGIVDQWLRTARHPRLKLPYTDLVYKPMLELLEYLRSNGFKTFIVSGGGAEFMRVFAERVYGIPPEQVIGSTIGTELQVRNGQPVLIRIPKVDFIDDKAAKPEEINKFIGRRPVFAFGNSDGDQQMLEWTATGSGHRFMGLVHHTDADREFAYDRASHVGTLDKAWDEATLRGWTVVDMKSEWNRIFK